MNDDRLDEILRQLREAAPVPSAEDRERMWNDIARRRPARLARWRRLAWPAGIAALLALGFGLGRYTGREPAGPVSVAGGPSAATPTLSPALAGAAVQHLSRTETFLTGFRLAADQRVPDAELLNGARDLLGTTRLLLDSPGLTDPRLRVLLQELEILLAQVTQLQHQPSREDSDLIVDQLDDTGVLPRLRTVIPSGPAANYHGES